MLELDFALGGIFSGLYRIQRSLVGQAYASPANNQVLE
jgi:hypothetical protein